MDASKYKPMTVSELAERWGVDRKTARRWIRPFYNELGKREGDLFTPRQVEIILKHLE